MNKQNFEALAEAEEKRLRLKEKRKRPRMKVSGAKLKELQKIILNSSPK